MKKSKAGVRSLKEAMIDSGVTVEDMMEATGRAQSTIYSWTRGRSGPTHKDASNVVHLLGITAAELGEIIEETKRRSGLS